MRTWWAWVMLTACGDAVEFAADDAPPPAALRIPYAQVSGLPLRFRLETPPVTARMRVYAGLHDAPGVCARNVPVVCIQLDQPVLLADVTLDPSGTTQVEVPWPAALDGEAGFFVQIAVAASRNRAVALPVTYEPLLAPTDDSDHDGLPAAEEHARYLLMNRADTDAGGTLDGQEVADGTDPRARRDDRRIESLCDNGIDDDRDGLADCEDSECADVCVEVDCGDGRDEDFDGAIDCTDEDCWTPACVDRTLAWTTHGSATTSWESIGGWGFHSMVRRFGSATGLVRAYKAGAQHTCTWRGRTTSFSSSPRYLVLPYRTRFEIGPPCSLGSEILPPVDPQLWNAGAWYGGQRFWGWTVGADTRFRPTSGWGGAEAGPLLNPVAFGGCPGGAPPVLAWPDLDADGFAMTEAVDLRGATVDRMFFCGAVPPGFTRVGGDCDDLDATWTPGLVVLDPGTSCADLSPSDRDGDGVSPPADPDDTDARNWGQELLCADGVDNDLDGLTDCEDGNCAGGPGCSELSCSDRRDNDQDGVADCADADCWGFSCNTSSIAWIMRGSVTGMIPGRNAGIEVNASHLIGKIRTGGPQGVNTCTWTADHAFAEYGQTWVMGRSGYPTMEPFSRVVRENVVITPGCFTGISALPRTFWPGPQALPSLGWYGPMRPTALGAAGRMEAGPALGGGRFVSRCGQPVTQYYTDADHDGYGVSDSLDMHGALGGLHYACGAAPAGSVTLGGDCDDGDPTWSPALIRRAVGVDCEAVRPDDRDGDGVLAAVDADDRDGAVR